MISPTARLLSGLWDEILPERPGLEKTASSATQTTEDVAHVACVRGFFDFLEKTAEVEPGLIEGALKHVLDAVHDIFGPLPRRPQPGIDAEIREKLKVPLGTSDREVLKSPGFQRLQKETGHAAPRPSGPQGDFQMSQSKLGAAEPLPLSLSPKGEIAGNALDYLADLKRQRTQEKYKLRSFDSPHPVLSPEEDKRPTYARAAGKLLMDLGDLPNQPAPHSPIPGFDMINQSTRGLLRGFQSLMGRGNAALDVRGRLGKADRAVWSLLSSSPYPLDHLPPPTEQERDFFQKYFKMTIPEESPASSLPSGTPGTPPLQGSWKR